MRGAAALAALGLTVALGCASGTVAPAPSIEEKVGQLFVVEGPGVFLNEASPGFRKLRHQVVDNHVGGVIWFRTHVYEAAVLAASLQKLAKTPLLFSSDLEAGTGMRFEDVTWGAPVMAIAATGDVTLAERRGRATAREARALGIAHVYAPVADVNVNPANPVINTRSFGEDAESVGRFASAFTTGLQAGGVLATLKHFPGHGDTAIDSHRALPVLDVDRARLDRVELVPFRMALAAGARSVMVAHLSVPALDDTPAPVRVDAEKSLAYGAKAVELEQRGTLPATLSPKIVDGLLRKELGFGGIVVTDSMTMGGVVSHFTPGEAAIRAILAGNDLVLHSPDPDAAIAAVVAAVRSGRIPEARLDASYRRIVDEKRRLGLFETRTPPLDDIARVVGGAESAAVEEEIARRSLTLLREEPGVLPLRDDATLFHLVVSDDSVPGTTATVSAALAKRKGTRTVLLDPRSCEADVASVLEAAKAADVVVVSLFVRVRSGAGKIAVPETARAAVEALATLGKPVVGVSFGSPYLLATFPWLKTYLCAYGIVDGLQVAVPRALSGEAAIEGRLPVTIPGLARRGDGIAKARSRP